MRTEQIIVPNNFELLCQVNHRKDKDGFDLITTTADFSAIECLRLLKKNKSPTLYAGLLLCYDGHFWNAEKDILGRGYRFFIDYARLSVSWLEAFSEASTNSEKWVPFYFADRSYARMKQENFKTITLVILNDDNKQLIRCPYLRLDYARFKKKLIEFAQVFIVFATQLLSLADAPEMNIKTSFKKQLKSSIQLEKWILILNTIQ